jgi:hypothetical protein
MHDSAFVAVNESLKQLEHKALYLVRAQWCTFLVEVLFKIQIEELEN